jgi:asparagine synthase (glutamine-hydrolysing)
MCGIAGIVDWGGRSRAEMADRLDRMDQAVARRGPDGHGQDVVAGAGGAVAYLAHRRLAILDRSEAGRQPMASADRRHWVTYNGEVYNFRELQPRVEGQGVTLRSSSDSEVLVELLAAEGDAAVSRLRGMFAFAWWDAGQATLSLVRDRFGIKPLFYLRPSPDLLVFASSPQAIAASGLCALRPGAGQRAAFLSRGSMAADESFWDGLSVVAPGSLVTADRSGCRRRTYWSLDGVWRRPRAERPVGDVAPRIRAALEDSVRAHLVSDVPVAVFLSGGVDSAALAAAARAQVQGRLQSITVTMPGSPLDESDAARAAALALDTAHTEVALEDLDRDQVLEEFLASLAQPTVDGFNTFLVARAARMAGVQVALSGVGGDELFGGYPSFVEVPKLHDLLRRGGPLARLGAPMLERWAGRRGAKFAAIAQEAPGSLDATWWAYRAVWPREDVSSFTGESAPHVPSHAGPAEAFDVIRDLEWRHFLERQLLPDADAVTMCRALELRTPFVDHVLVEEVAASGRWPRGDRHSWKAALFDAWPDWTPAATRDRRKRGFVLPMEAWLREALTQSHPPIWRDVADRLRAPRHADAVRRFLDGRLHWSRLWALYVLERVEARSA